MEKILIRVKDRKKADLLMQFLKALDFVDSVSSADIPANEMVAERDVSSADFFALAGIWAGREITLSSVRKKAWPERK